MSWVLKLGGSQYTDARLKKVIGHASAFNPPPVIVPGGGPFADQVRRAQKRWAFADETAHKMAILAMRQYGELLADLGQIQVAEGHRLSPPCVWLPDMNEQYEPADWTFTSDSIALHLAKVIGAECVVLLKAVCDEPLEKLVDEQFIQLAKSVDTRIAVVDVDAWLGANNLDDLRAYAVKV